MHATKTRLFVEWVDSGEDVAARPGVPELPQDLSATAITVAVASTGRSGWIVPLLRRMFPPGTFEVVVAGEAIALDDSPPGLAAARTGTLAEEVTAAAPVGLHSAADRSRPPSQPAFPQAATYRPGWRPGGPADRAAARSSSTAARLPAGWRYSALPDTNERAPAR